MKDKAHKTNPYLAPHINAEPHRRLMELLDSMGEEERAEYLFDISVEAGIYTPDGKLTEHYRDSDEKTIAGVNKL
jgi:hypothetical protein